MMQNSNPGLWETFMERVQRQGDCWLWIGARTGEGGYGLLSVLGKTRLAHRVAYELWYGPFPPDLDVCHHCDNPPCIRPSHLFLGTALDNMRDKMEKGRWRGGRPRGRKDTRPRRTRRRLDAFDRRFIRRRLWPPEKYAELLGTPLAAIEAVLNPQGRNPSPRSE